MSNIILQTFLPTHLFGTIRLLIFAQFSHLYVYLDYMFIWHSRVGSSWWEIESRHKRKEEKMRQNMYVRRSCGGAGTKGEIQHNCLRTLFWQVFSWWYRWCPVILGISSSLDFSSAIAHRKLQLSRQIRWRSEFLIFYSSNAIMASANVLMVRIPHKRLRTLIFSSFCTLACI